MRLELSQRRPMWKQKRESKDKGSKLGAPRQCPLFSGAVFIQWEPRPLYVGWEHRRCPSYEEAQTDRNIRPVSPGQGPGWGRDTPRPGEPRRSRRESRGGSLERQDGEGRRGVQRLFRDET